jgi:hypothetical protein
VRGFFPAETFHIRYAVFHGIAIGVSSIVVKIAFSKMEYAASGWRAGLMSVGACALLLLVIYGVAVFVEQMVVAGRGCVECGSHRMRPAS